MPDKTTILTDSSYNWIPYNGPFPEEGNALTIIIEGTKLCLGNYKGGYYAVSDKCPHAGDSLGGGEVNERGDIVCPVHQMTFNMASGKNTSGEGYRPINCYPVKQQGDKYFVGLPLKKKWFAFWK